MLFGDWLLAEKVSYGAQIPFSHHRLPAMRQPEQGDIVVFRSPGNPDRFYIKRCLAIAGQTIEVRDKRFYVDGRRLADPPFSKNVDSRIYAVSSNSRDNMRPITVPDGYAFVVGDNRDNSRDSRHWGALPTASIVARGLFVYWSVKANRSEDLSEEGVKPPLWHAMATLPSRIRWARVGEFVL